MEFTAPKWFRNLFCRRVRWKATDFPMPQDHICYPCQHVAFSGHADVCGYFLSGGDVLYVTNGIRGACDVYNRRKLASMHYHEIKPLTWSSYWKFKEKR